MTLVPFGKLVSVCLCVFFSVPVPAISASTDYFTETQVLTLENPPPIADLGYSVAASDGLLIAGGINISTDKGDVGGAYIYEETSAGIWVQAAELLAKDGEHNDTFGFDVAIEGDFAIVGSISHEEESTGEGAAYFFLRNGDTNWEHAQQILAPADTRDFGAFLDISGSKVVVAGRKRGAPGAGNTRGFVNIYESSGNAEWAQVQQIDIGLSVPNFLVSGLDLDKGTLVVGGGKSRSPEVSSERFVEIYEDSNRGFQLAATLESLSDPKSTCCFGASVAIDSDRLIVGDPLDTEHGAAFVYERDDSGLWEFTARLSASDSEQRLGFGAEVAMHGDLAFVADVWSSGQVFGSGRVVYVFEQNHERDWREVGKITSSAIGFGYALAAYGEQGFVGAGLNNSRGTIHVISRVPEPSTAVLLIAIACIWMANGRHN